VELQRNGDLGYMLFPDSFKVSTPSDREIRVTRNFDPPRSLVFDAFTKPELVRRWLLGPPGWTMPLFSPESQACSSVGTWYS
jgi:hypothetical protein